MGRRFGGLKAAQFIGVGKFIQAFQAKEFQKYGSRFVKERTSRLLGTARDADYFPLEQRGDDTVNRHAAHRFDLGAADRLTISDDGQRFKCRLAQPGRLRAIEEPVRPDCESGPGLQLKASSDSLHSEARSTGLQLRV